MGNGVKQMKHYGDVSNINGAEVVGFFDLGTIDYIYLSKKREGGTAK